MKCRICGKEGLELVLDLGFHPPSDAFLTEGQLKEPETWYPLRVMKCGVCGLAQLDYVVEPEILYQNGYPYVTGENTEGVRHFRRMAESVIRRCGVGRDSFVVDIGGNDGTLLKSFQEIAGCKVLNIDPSGVPVKVQTCKVFWGEETARELMLIRPKADVITATNVFAHCDDLHDFMRGVDLFLNKGGVFIIEAPAFECLVENCEYDTIYHEHLSYLDTGPIDYLVKLYNMELFGTERHEIHGGTNRYFIRRICAES